VIGEVGYFVYGKDKALPSKMLETLEDAKKEMERLAKMNPGVKFFLYMPVQYCRTRDNPIEWVNV
jgi:hypothetical protein